MCIHKYIWPGSQLYICMYKQDWRTCHTSLDISISHHRHGKAKYKHGQSMNTKVYSWSSEGACMLWKHDLLVFIFRLINDLCNDFPNHVSICQSLQDIRNLNFSLISRCTNVGSLEQILANKDWRSLIFTRHLVTKCSSSSISRLVEQSFDLGLIWVVYNTRVLFLW